MITVDKLKEYGANTEEGLARCCGNEGLYLRLVATIPSQPGFDQLGKQISEGDLKGAFESAHALKGATGNLSLTPLYDKICEITELLRAQTVTDYSSLTGEISDLRDELKSLCD